MSAKHFVVLALEGGVVVVRRTLRSLIFRHHLVILSVCILGTATGLSQTQSDQTYQRTRRLLTESPRLSDDSLRTLFQLGSEQIEDLEKALDDNDEVVKINAQIVIRYLGSESGMKALIRRYTTSRTILLAGPVPLPLRDWDYAYIRRSYLEKFEHWDSRATSYVYALALDGSPKALALLNELNVRHQENSHFALNLVRANAGTIGVSMDNPLTRAVVDNAFFLSSAYREQASATILAFDRAGSRCLVVVYVGDIPSVTETYHVVLQRYDRKWKFFSVTQVAVS